MLFVGTSIIHPSTEGVFLLCNILDLLIYSYENISHQTDAAPYSVHYTEAAVDHEPVLYLHLHHEME